MGLYPSSASEHLFLSWEEVCIPIKNVTNSSLLKGPQRNCDVEIGRYEKTEPSSKASFQAGLYHHEE